MKPSKVHKTSTASTATDSYETKDLQNGRLLSGRCCGRYLRLRRLRSITTHLRAVTVDNIARTKSPQIGTFAALRSMRSVFCGTSFCVMGRSGDRAKGFGLSYDKGRTELRAD